MLEGLNPEQRVEYSRAHERVVKALDDARRCRAQKLARVEAEYERDVQVIQGSWEQYLTKLYGEEAS